MTTSFANRRTISITLAVLTLMVWCGAPAYAILDKTRTKWSLDSAKSKLVKAQEYRADIHYPTELKTLQDQINQAEGAMNGGDFITSLQVAKSAVTAAKGLVTRARAAESQAARQRAELDMKVARDNRGQQENLELFEMTNVLLTEMQGKHDAGKHDAVIELSKEIASNVLELLGSLKSKAIEARAEVDNRIEKMQQEEVLQWVPTMMSMVEDQAKEIDSLIDEQRLYRVAIQKANDAKKNASEGIIEAQRRKCESKISNIELGVAEALSLGAGSDYAVPLYEQCKQSYGGILDRYLNKEYSVVLESIDLLQDKVDNLIIQTKREAAEAAIDGLSNELIALVDGGARDYQQLVAGVDEIDKQLTKAKSQFDVAQYDEARDTCKTGMENARQTKDNFDSLAVQRIASADDAHNRSDSVYKRAVQKGFFILSDTSDMSDVDIAFENSKEAAMESIRSSIAAVRAQLARARDERGKEKFQRAIEISDEAKKQAMANEEEVMHVAAHNAMTELAARLRFLTQDSAVELAATETDQATKQLANVRQAVRGGKFTDALDRAAQTRSSLEMTVVAMHTAVKESLDAAQQAADAAREEGVPQEDPGRWSEINALLNQAGQHVAKAPALDETEAHYRAANKAVRDAQQLVAVARNDRRRKEAATFISQAEMMIEKAEAAGAERYSAQLTQGARERLAQAQSLVAADDFAAAALMAADAKRFATDGFYALVNEAEDAIATARAYRGWDLERDLLATAIIDARTSREKLDVGAWAESHKLAQQAKESATRIARSSKTEDFRMRIRQLEELLRTSLQSGSNYFQTAEVKGLIADLKELDQGFSSEEFDRYNEGLARIASRIGDMVAATPEAMAQCLAAQRSNIAELERLGANGIARYELELARRSFDQAEADFAAGAYTRSYEMMLRGARLSCAINEELSRANFASYARESLDNLQQTMMEFKQVLVLSPTAMVQMVSGYNAQGRVLAMAGGASPARFAERTRDIYEKAVELKAPATMIHIHQDLILASREAMIAGQLFQKFLILDQYDTDTRQKIITDAYDHIDKAKKKQAYLQERLLTKDERLPDSYQPPLEKLSLR